MEFLTLSGNIPFSIALAVVFLLGALEAVSLLVGGASSLLNTGGPDLNLPNAPNLDAPGLDVPNLDAHGLELHGPDIHSPQVHVHAANGNIMHGATSHGEISPADGDAGPLSEALSWLHVGQLPSSILMMLLLLGFGLGGLFLQTVVHSRFGTVLPAGVAVWPAGVIALLTTRLSGGLLKPILPRDETEAVSIDSFVGCAGQITVGTARPGRPAEARVKDRYGRTHYVMVEPDGEDEFPAGSHILLIKRHNALYRAIDNTGAQVD